MPRGYGPSKRYPVFLGLLCAILAVVLVVQLTSGDEDFAEAPPAKPQPRKPGQEAETQSGFAMPPEGTYTEVSERPLFFRSRRPLPPEVVTHEETPADTSRVAFILSGVILTETQRMALLKSQSSPKIARVEEGQEFEGWIVEAIHANKVVMRRGQEVSEVALEDNVRTSPPRLRRSDRKRATPKQPPENEDGTKEKKEDGMKEKKGE